MRDSPTSGRTWHYQIRARRQPPATRVKYLSGEELPSVAEQLHQAIDRLEQVTRGPNGEGLHVAITQQNNAELRAFMIEALLLLRYFARDDLKGKGEIGRKIQKAVGDIRVEGT